MEQLRYLDAEAIYHQLIHEYKLYQKSGVVSFSLGAITLKYKGKDALGHLIQEWLGSWMQIEHIFHKRPENSQDFPDYLIFNEARSGFLEVKTFNSDSSPAFDIANYDSYCRSLLTTPTRLDADYLILSYKMADSLVHIDQAWLKKVWQISSPSKDHPVKLQVKNGQIYNLRPCTWYSEKLQYKPFNSRLEFIEALASTVECSRQSETYAEKWLDKVRKSYFEATGTDL